MSDINVKHVAKLSNLLLSQEEEKLYATQFKSILNYIDQLGQVNTTDIKPTYQVLDNTVNILRKDEVESGLSQEEALSQARKTHKGYFVVENVFDKKEKKKSSVKIKDN